MLNSKNLNLLVSFIILIVSINLCNCQVNDGGTHEKWEYVLEDTGDILQLALPAAAGLTTIFKKDWEGTKQFAFSYATSFVVAQALKKVVRKKRPEGRNLYDAFPSGHTTSAFTGAAFIQRRYGWKYGKYAYFLASIVGVSRMEGPDGWHDIWDVLAGAGIGIGSTYLFTKPYEQSKYNISLSYNRNQIYFSFNYRF